MAATGFAACQSSALTDPTPAVRPDDSTAPAPSVLPSIDVERMLTDVAYLANDQLAGRDSRSAEHITRAANYIAASHRAAGVPAPGPDYLVEFEMEVDTKMGRDLHLWVERDGASEAMSEGYVVAKTSWDGEPAFGSVVEAPASATPPAGVDGRVVVVRLPAAEQRRRTVAAMFEAGARGVVGVLPAAETLPSLDTADELGADLPGPVLVMTLSAARERLPWRARRVRGKRAQPIEGLRLSMAPISVPILEPRPNVVAALPGRTHPDEIIVLGAHYDHIGREDDGVFCRDPDRASDPDDSVCNGADDNASGTAMVMEIARVAAELSPRPQRTIAFAHFAGEELGLLGSKALVDALETTPPFAGSKVVAMLNLDMVGRYRESVGLSIGAVSTSPHWGDVLDGVDPRGLTIVRDPSVNSRSDHANFHRVGVPVLFFFTGLHPDYHRTSDELELVNRDGMNRIAQFVLDVTLRISSGPAIARNAPAPTP